MNRLTSMSSPLDTCLGLTWIYDAWSNRSGQTGTGGICNSDPETVLANNQLSGYNYDAAGNMIWDGQHHYTYDAENRIISVDSGTVQFVYDAQGRRVGKITASGWRDYLYGTGGEVLSEATLSGSTFGWPSGYAYFGGQLLAQYENSTTYFATHDHLGSARLMTVIDQTVYDSLDYLPFGEQIAGNWGTTHKYETHERDSETGLDNFGKRYYESGLGRFTTPDPLMASGHTSNPQSWNRYAFSFNNPLRFIDPDGLEVPQSCAKDKKCQITVRVNVIWDKTANKGKGLTEKQKQEFQKNQINKAVKDYAKSGIKLEVSYTDGSFTVDNGNHPQFTGLQSDAVNVVASDQTIDGSNESFMTKSGTPITLINVNDVHDNDAFPLFTNSTEHELAHHFLGDTAKSDPGFAAYMANEFTVDARVQGQHVGISQKAFREGLEPRTYANPTNPEGVKPQQH